MIIALIVGLVTALSYGLQPGAGQVLPQIPELRARIEKHVDSPDRKRAALSAVDELKAAREAGVRRIEAQVLSATPLMLTQDVSEADLRGAASFLLAEDAAGDANLLRLRGTLHAVLTREEWLAVFE